MICKFRSLAILAIAAVLVVAAHAQDKITIAGGGGAKNGSTYSAIIADLAEACSTDKVTIEEANTTGGVANLDLVRNNKMPFGIIPSDLLFALRQDNASSVAQIKSLFPLHNEAVHIIVRADVKTEGGYNVFGKNLGGKEVVFDSLEALRGRPVGVVEGSGSAITARIINDTLKLGFVITPGATSTKDLTDKLVNHTFDAIIVAGSAAAVAKLPRSFRLLPLRGNQETATVYVPTKVQYDNLNNGRAVDTLAAQAIMATRIWRSPDMLAKAQGLKACFYKSLDTIRDKSGTDPIWQSIESTTTSLWPAYEFATTGSKK